MPAVIVAFEIVSVEVPVFVTMIVLVALAAPTSTEPNASGFGLSLICGATPVQLSGMSNGLVSGSLLWMWMFPDLDPVDVGEQRTEICWLEPTPLGWIVQPPRHGLLVKLNSVLPVIVADEIARSMLPAFVSVTVCALLFEKITTLPNASDAVS